MQKINVYNVNKRIENIKNNNIELITNKQYIQQTYNKILVPVSSSVHSGEIMTFNQANERFKKYFPNESISREEYDELLTSLMENYGEQLTVSGAKEYQKNYMIDFINENSLIEHDFSNYSYSTLVKIFREAKEKSSKKGDYNYEANKFTVNLDKMLEELIT